MKKWARFVKRARDEEQRDRLNVAIVEQTIIMLGLALELQMYLGKCWICQR